MLFLLWSSNNTRGVSLHKVRWTIRALVAAPYLCNAGYQNLQ